MFLMDFSGVKFRQHWNAWGIYDISLKVSIKNPHSKPTSAVNHISRDLSHNDLVVCEKLRIQVSLDPTEGRVHYESRVNTLLHYPN